MTNSKDWRSKNVNAIELNCKVVKTVVIPFHFYINPSFSGLSPLSSKTLHTPSSDSIFERYYPDFNKGGCEEGGGGGEVPTMFNFFPKCEIVEFLFKIHYG